MTPRITASIDLQAIRHNLRRVRELAPRSKVMAAIKADGYGHGATAVAMNLPDCDAFAVACLEEAVSLRDAGISQPLTVLAGVLSAEEAAAAQALDLELVIHAEWQLQLLEQLQPARPLKLWLKLDTGMHRLGFAPQQAQALFARVDAQVDWQFCGWMTHLACADVPDQQMSQRQLQEFSTALDGLSGPRSIANSAGIVNQLAEADWVRPGLMLYGASPVPDRSAAELGLQPAMRVSSRLIAIKDVPSGHSVGYGATWICPRDMRIGIVAVGYGDGWPRSLPNGTPVELRGQRLPMVGRVSMDMITVDLADCDASIGDEVTLWGSAGLPVEQIAAAADTLSYELLCGLTQRVKFRYLNDLRDSA